MAPQLGQRQLETSSPEMGIDRLAQLGQVLFTRAP
jgi:hypothetical protein